MTKRLMVRTELAPGTYIKNAPASTKDIYQPTYVHLRVTFYTSYNHKNSVLYSLLWLDLSSPNNFGHKFTEFMKVSVLMGLSIKILFGPIKSYVVSFIWTNKNSQMFNISLEDFKKFEFIPPVYLCMSTVIRGNSNKIVYLTFSIRTVLNVKFV